MRANLRLPRNPEGVKHTSPDLPVRFGGRQTLRRSPCSSPVLTADFGLLPPPSLAYNTRRNWRNLCDAFLLG